MFCSKNLLSSLTLVALTVITAAHGGELTQVKVETSAGDFVLQMDADRAPLSVANFLQYVRDGFYDGTIFHRVVNGFVIQGGGYAANMEPKPPRPSIPNEAGNGLTNRRGSVAMARTGDPHSADAQFYVNLADNLALDPKPTRWGYAVFGEVIQGLEIVDKIGHQVTSIKDGMQDVPIENVVIRKVTVLKTPIAR
ncbi:MAG: peptidyl-prolyl cis-trans isomerase [Chromatiales bacterium]|jgi:cyclophilin family peptidyl-prolyl cis-trans isomerase|nr:MAG: peptidyl-prolyl cis-trans isomerase [Chromatiales bacterium]